MKIDFFEKEVKKARKRFNELYGTQTVCNIEERQTLILAVCRLGVLSMRSKSNAENKELLKEFINNRNKLNQYFNQKERRKTYVEHTNRGAIGKDTEIIRDRACQAQR